MHTNDKSYSSPQESSRAAIADIAKPVSIADVATTGGRIPLPVRMLPMPLLDRIRPIECREPVSRVLIKLCEWIEARIADPVRVCMTKPGVRRVEVFGVLAYCIDYNNRAFYISHRDSKTGAWKDRGADDFVEVIRPFNHKNWISDLVKLTGLEARIKPGYKGDRKAERQVEEFNGIISNYVVALILFRILQRDSLFVNFRKQVLPAKFGLPPKLLAMAMRARIAPISDFLDSRTLNAVWKNQEAYELVAKENPKLLTLLTAYLFHYGNDALAGRDPVQCMKETMRESGISEACWKYLTRHGARMFKALWHTMEIKPRFRVMNRGYISNEEDIKRRAGTSSFEEVIAYLRALQDAGLPPPLPPSILLPLTESILSLQIGAQSNPVEFAHKSPAVFRLCAQEAERRLRGGKADSEFIKEMFGVYWWSCRLDKKPDRNQIRAGWPWLVKQWRNAEKKRIALAKAKDCFWPTLVEEFVTPQFRIVPLKTGEEIVRDGLTMRHCLADGDFDKTLTNDKKRELYSVRHPVSGKQIGTVGIGGFYPFQQYDYESRGYANSLPSPLIKKAIAEIDRRRRKVKKEQGIDVHDSIPP